MSSGTSRVLGPGRLEQQQNWQALEYANPELKNDKAVVLEAVMQNGYALEYADPELKKDLDDAPPQVQFPKSEQPQALTAEEQAAKNKELERLYLEAVAKQEINFPEGSAAGSPAAVAWAR